MSVTAKVSAISTIDTDQISLEGEIKSVLSKHFLCSPERIIFQENKTKYHNESAPLTADDDLSEIFHLMKNLNIEGITDPLLCTGSDGGNSFSASLLEAIGQFAEKYKGKKINYIELGPEPIKTKFIIEYLISMGVSIDTYCSVDINPASAAYMRESLADILPAASITHQISAFENFRMDSEVFDDLPVLVTMLGFQEGNDESSTMNSWMKNIVKKDGYLLSEMQLMSEDTRQQVIGFYRNPNMIRFSKVAFTRAFGDLDSNYSSVLLPLTQKSGEKVNAMMMIESFTDVDGAQLHLVTNFCLKYTSAQYHQHRVQDQSFDVEFESLTGDNSVVFQLSRRT